MSCRKIARYEGCSCRISTSFEPQYMRHTIERHNLRGEFTYHTFEQEGKASSHFDRVRPLCFRVVSFFLYGFEIRFRIIFWRIDMVPLIKHHWTKSKKHTLIQANEQLLRGFQSSDSCAWTPDSSHYKETKIDHYLQILFNIYCLLFI